MKSILKTAAFAVLAVVGVSGSAQAASLLNLSVLGSTAPSGTYTNNLSGIDAGTTVYYEIVAQYASAGTTNSNTAKSPNGTQDSANALPYLNLSDNGGTFNTDTALSSAFSQGTGANAGNNSTTSIGNIRAIGANGVFTNLDARTVILSGSFVTTAESTGITLAEDAASAAGSLKVGGTLPTSIVGVNGTTENSADHLISVTGLTISGASSPVPAPSALAGVVTLAGLCSIGAVARRRSILA